MRGQWTKLAGIAVLLLLIAVESGHSATQLPATQAPTATTAASFPIGIFAKGNYTWDFKADGSYVSQSSEGGEKGTYTATGNQIIIQGDYCGDVKGTYTWAYDGKALSFNALDDRCTDRLNVIVPGQWLKKTVSSEALEPARLAPEDMKWFDTPSGVYIAKLAGDDQATGMYVIRYRFPANFKVRPHFHPDDRVATVLSGTLYVGYGEQFDEAGLKALPAGSIWTEPAKQAHFVWAKDGEVTIQVVGNGPSASTPVAAKQ
jgi:quercetin dioxygenase-like cupin family protein